ncbi:MAG: adenine phosphoribosyltransferase [Flavobacteriales bacterium]|nr:adenine phosphoribosyltransferase [Flavobacteriales bacterium]MCZ2443432.1 adenine phosphoribosyltransferase [Flavobacteriales bacterium]
MNQAVFLQHIREIPDFPKPGIIFKDITPVFSNPTLCNELTEEFVRMFEGERIDAVVGIEARGFLFGILIASYLQVPFIPIRKAGKLPYQKISREYALEYGVAKIEMHIDAIQPGQRVLLHDDLLATGGSAEAASELIKEVGGELVGLAFLLNLSFLEGEKRLQRFGVPVKSIARF